MTDLRERVAKWLAGYDLGDWERGPETGINALVALLRAERAAVLEKAATGVVRDHGGCVDEATLRGTVAWLRTRAEEERR